MINKIHTVYLKATETCNLNCAHCFTSGANGAKVYWDVQKTKDWITQLVEQSDQRYRINFILHGGEAMLAPLEQLIEVRDHVNSFGERTSVGIATNLTYVLTPERRDFLNSLNGMATSWDPSIRFSNDKQLMLWKKNLQTLIDDGMPIRLNVSLSKKVMDIPQELILSWAKLLGVDELCFEPIVASGNAVGSDIMPTNRQRDAWTLRLHEVVQEYDARQWFNIPNLEEIYAKFEKGDARSGTFCRNCEQSIFTVNATGTVGGCPNTASQEYYASIDEPVEQLLTSDARAERIVKEQSRKDWCYDCEVYRYCGSGCHQLAWDETGCPSPKMLMKKLAGSDKKIIPIVKV